ncbi:F0F1 ATP synthase subunit B family protein [Gimibacter soli]|uniref:ATP synthase subunit b n=1 Tax=Gimibacter soli TaxID=3024400 RepID=A0AAF0BMG7_9PROT|nr:ATP F0F1 synthase subunit B [Gimibacter soli]WCL55517.1 ATP F0F1 synthase subunit B [Gimibacter soli]
MAAGEPFYLDPTFWVAGSFVVFVGGVIYAKAHKTIAAALDGRAAAIKAQIDEAAALREETAKLLSDFQRKKRDAEKEAADIVAQAKEDAKLLIAEAKADMKAMVERRTASAELKIAQAEAAAVKEVKAVAVTVAVAAATDVLADALKGAAGGKVIDAAIGDIDTLLH